MIDLRSDTVTRPDAAMRQAMMDADVGDDVYGEDPTINALEARVASLLGHEAGIFCPSGSMTNMLGVAALVAPGWELIAESQAHVLRAEAGGHAALAGVTSRTWVSPDGTFTVADALALMSRPRGYHQVGTAAIAVENTHNFGGGRIADIDELRTLRRETAAAGVAVHMDGARLLNACAATGISAEEYGRQADTVSLCLSKGLGAPVGSVLVGRADVIEKTRLLRKRYGGAMRQAGILAAAGLYALDNHVAGLADDNAHARQLADALAAAREGIVDPAAVETNIVFLDVSDLPVDAEQFAAQAAERSVRVSVMGENSVRLVTHRDVSPEQIDTAAEVLTSLV